jgi:hypothetical protein
MGKQLGHEEGRGRGRVNQAIYRHIFRKGLGSRFLGSGFKAWGLELRLKGSGI